MQAIVETLFDTAPPLLNKLEVIRYEIFATNSSIKRFTCSGLSGTTLGSDPLNAKDYFAESASITAWICFISAS